MLYCNMIVWCDLELDKILFFRQVGLSCLQFFEWCTYLTTYIFFCMTPSMHLHYMYFSLFSVMHLCASSDIGFDVLSFCDCAAATIFCFTSMLR